MATQKEVDDCCSEIVKLLAQRGVSDEMKTARITIMGIFLLENFLLDVKRIADVLSEAANEQDGMGNK